MDEKECKEFRILLRKKKERTEEEDLRYGNLLEEFLKENLHGMGNDTEDDD